MKSIILFIILFNICYSKSDDFEKYKQAYNYILNDSINLNSFNVEIFKDNYPKLCVSNKITYISYFDVEHCIMQHEFHTNDPKKVNFDSLISLIHKLDSLNNFTDYYYDTLLTFNLNPSPKLIVYFSKIENDTVLKASIFVYNNTFDFKTNSLNSFQFIFYLFYFKNDKIDEVCNSIWAQ